MQTFSAEQIEEGNKRLLLAAQATRETKHPNQFTMELYGIEECNTPACVLGNYAFRTDLQRTFKLAIFTYTLDWSPGEGKGIAIYRAEDGPTNISRLDCDAPSIQAHFALTQPQAIDLFAYNGCGRAQTPEEAAEFIEKFVMGRRMLADESKQEQDAQMPAPPEDQAGL